MRLIGHLDNEQAARTFADYLCVQHIDCQLEFQKGEGWGIWVMDEDNLENATGLLTAFRQNPQDPTYQTEGKGAAKLRAEQQKSEEAYRKRQMGRRYLFRPLRGYGFGILTYILIVACVVVAILSKLGTDKQALMGLFISTRDAGSLSGLTEIRQGELWRLITPIFIHFGPVHLLFNMLWLKDLGSMIEDRQSMGYLAMLVVVLAVCSNVAQYYWGGWYFGGMSGVVYGLLGYIWIRGRFDPGSGLFVDRLTVAMMMVWFFLCCLGMVGDIANMAHTVGLGVGMLWGFLSSLRYR
jgi:GlpG protein